MALFKKSTQAPTPQAAKEIKNWYKDRYQNALVWRNILAVATLVALLISLVSVAAVYQLTPLKTVEPFVIQVDEKSGITQVVKPLSEAELSTKKELNDFFIAQYIRARESYDVNSLSYNREVVRLMSSENIFRDYITATHPNNPESPSAVLKTEGSINVRVRSVTLLEKGVAQVRFVKTVTSRETQRNLYKIALIAYRYINLELNQEQRAINPLGFYVTSYQVSDEVVQ